jgi:hypothetical protein
MSSLISSPHFGRNRRGGLPVVSPADTAGNDATIVASSPAAPAGTSPQAMSVTQGRRVHARIDSAVADPRSQAFSSPLKSAEQHIENTTASLREGVATLFQDKGKKYLALAHKLHVKSKT